MGWVRCLGICPKKNWCAFSYQNKTNSFTVNKFYISKRNSCCKGLQSSNIVKLGTDRGLGEGQKGIKGIWFCCPLPELHIRHLPILKTFATSLEVSEISFGRRIYVLENVLNFFRFYTKNFVVKFSLIYESFGIFMMCCRHL